MIKLEYKGIVRRMERALNQTITSIGPLSGGCVGEVYQARLSSGEQVVVKIDQRDDPQLAIEGYMLSYLRAQTSVPVPDVYYSSDELLVISFVPGDSTFTSAAEEDLAEILADLHSISTVHFGLHEDTLIGMLRQPNGWWDSWVAFFREQRLLYLGRLAVEMEQMPQEMLQRIHRFADRLETWLDEPERPSLIHGDLWSANVLAVDDRITGLIDPAIYYADAEIELAYMRLFHSFGERFFHRYHELRPIRAGFFEVRQHVYNLYPLLSHVCHFGGNYVASVDDTLTRFGC